MSEVPSTSSGQAPSTSHRAEALQTEGSGQVLYRRWRPQAFAQVVGQEPVTRTLRNSVASGRIAHAYLLCGPRGTGKTSLGRLIAKAANCETPIDGEPCNQCQSCLAFLEGRAVDLVEMDAASNRGIDEIRKLKDRVGLAPMGGRYKLYLIDEVHMLTPEAYNALLKTLEEPPPHVLFVLATTEPQRVPPTIISRCQRFDLRRIPLSDMVQWLSYICQQEGFRVEEAALQEMARSASGSLRDAINILEQLTTYYGPAPSLEQVQEALGLSVDARSGQLACHILAQDLSEGLRLIAAVRDDGVEPRQFSRQTVAYLRNLLLVKSGAEETLDLTKEQLAEMHALAAKTEAADILRALRTFGRLDFRDDPQSSLPLELALVEYVSAGGALPARPKASLSLPAEPAAPAEEPPESAFNLPAVPTPTPAPEAEPRQVEARGPSVPAGDDLLERIRLACKDIDKQVAALLNGSCEITAVEGDTIVLGFYFDFHLGKIEMEASRRVVEAAASRVLGRAISVKCTRTERPPLARPTQGGHLVQAARALGARPLSGGKGGGISGPLRPSSGQASASPSSGRDEP